MFARLVAMYKVTYIFENEDCRGLHVPDASTCSAVDYIQKQQRNPTTLTHHSILFYCTIRNIVVQKLNISDILQ